MRQLVLVLIVAFFYAGAWGQCPTGNITLYSQTQINSFAADYPGCTEMLGSINISEGSSWSQSITSLDGLNQITSIEGDLKISTNPDLTDLSGLENLTSIGDGLEIRDKYI